ncbi:hypothetical protein [Nocardioides nitrophenolicus]|uniref:hypothetical protein n=1 Tax=Nocardioides nitrophenolicus TaxID=60489 RepID=UPI00195BEF10|nr:hypothetical protein [Nocardioides nitrophenolicus]MBM7516208.1 hypothetical protein [Nocardioides nitrophenolicus]
MRAEGRLAAVLVVAVLGLVGCSGEDEPAPGPSAAPTTTAATAAFDCAPVSDADLSEWLGVPLTVATDPTDDGGTACSATDLGDQLLLVEWAPLTGAGDLDVAANRVFADRDPAPVVEETALPGGAPARMVVTETPGTQIQVDLVSLNGRDGLHVVVSAGATGDRLTLGRDRLVDAAARIADAYAAPAG